MLGLNFHANFWEVIQPRGSDILMLQFLEVKAPMKLLA